MIASVYPPAPRLSTRTGNPPAGPTDAATGLPPILTTSSDYLLSGYAADHRIRFGTGRVVAQADLAACAAMLLAHPQIAFVDLRSARNDCCHLRICRSPGA